MEETKVTDQEQNEQIETGQHEETEEVKDAQKTQKKATKTTKKKEEPNTQSDELKALQADIESLKTQLNDKDSKLIELQTKLSDIETKSSEQLATIQKKDVELKLAQKGLTEFQEFFANVQPEKLDEQIEKFQSLMKQKEIDNSFKPNNYTQDDKLTQAKNKGDLKSYIGALFGANK